MKNLDQALKKYFGFDSFRANQQQIIEHLLSGNNTFVIKPTGGGKSLCYQLPALVSEGTALVISPLIALMKNQVDAMRARSIDDSVAHFLNSSLEKDQIDQVKKDVLEQKTKLLYIAPESLQKKSVQTFLSKAHISFVAVDEAHCISEWGHDFRPEYRKIKQVIESLCGPKAFIALTATATLKVQQDILNNLGIENAQVFKSSFNRLNLFYNVTSKQNLESKLIGFVKKYAGKSGIVYCMSRKKVEQVTELLNLNGVSAVAYHAGFDRDQRAENQELFIKDKVNVIVATIAFGMGIDKPNVRFVVHYDLPKTIESYYQETGRAGRDGLPSECLTFFSQEDVEKFEHFISKKNAVEELKHRFLLDQVVHFFESGICRRKFILKYFGEDFQVKDCAKHCDNCNYDAEQTNIENGLKQLFLAIQVMKEQASSKQLEYFLKGNLSPIIKQYEFDQHAVFGALKQYDSEQIKALIINAYVEGYTDLNFNESAYYSNTQKSFDQDFSIVMNRDLNAQDNLPSKASQKQNIEYDKNLFELLNKEVRQIAELNNLPPYVVFSEVSIIEMASKYPTSEQEMVSITGVGAGKAKKYAASLIKIVQDFVEQNNIEKQEHFAIKTIANKSVHKIHIIQSIDRKMPFEDIAGAKKLSIDELLSQIEIIVESGTKVNIDYYLNDLFDEDQQEDFIEYFKETESDCVDSAVEEFEDEGYSREDIRLMRIHFLSKYAH